MEINSDAEESFAPQNFYYWKDLFPELNILYRNQDIIAEECKNINSVSSWWVVSVSDNIFF
jgi:hypothetical protein